MTLQEHWEEINKNEGLCNTLFNLYCRWQDEKEYEDINDYIEVIKKKYPCAYKMSKKPFGFHVDGNDGTLFVFVKRKGNYLCINGSFERRVAE